MSKAARSLQELDAEIAALKQKARRLEDELDESWAYFQEHSGQMFVRSILPRSLEGLVPLTGIRVLDAILQSERLQRIIERLAGRSAAWLGDGLNWLTNRIFKDEG
ncbi:MAG TPA: hypothetical protein VKU83_00730 [Puia sp.]|nr:hypothetical protein [Puia sp.]